MRQADIDRENAEFWNELCGTGLAQHLGITDHTPESLARFDQFYYDLYPYLLPWVQPERMAGKDVLEIGLGYGSLGQRIAAAGARYRGLDIAPNAARMMNLRMQMQDFDGEAVCGSALEMPFPDARFDFVVSVGCFHHTGDVQRCFDETFRVLRPGGTALLMVYNKFSFRQWTQWPGRTLKEVFRGLLPARRQELATDQRWSYDHNRAGAAAPETVLLSIRELRRMLARYASVTCQKQNCDPLVVRGKIWAERMKLLPTLGRWLGLDVYITARKAAEARNRHAA